MKMPTFIWCNTFKDRCSTPNMCKPSFCSRAEKAKAMTVAIICQVHQDGCPTQDVCNRQGWCNDKRFVLSQLPPNPKQAYGDKKIPMHLIPSAGQIHEALAFKEGARKYG